MRTVLNSVRARVGEESGFAVVVAMTILAITLGLGAVAATVAIHTNSSSNRDTRLKAAVEAADAGLRTAAFRLNADKPGDNYCPTTPTFAAVDANGLCAQDGPEALGNGATFSYWISRAMQTGDACTGPAVSSTASDVAQRCITAVGTANGVSARLQERVAAYTSTPVFPAAIFGTKSVTINNNVTISTDTPGFPGLLGTNGTLYIAPTGGGTTTIDGYAIPATANVSTSGNVVNLGPVNTNVPPYPIPTPINPGFSSQNTTAPYDSATTYQGGTCAVSATQRQTNCDYRVTRGISSPGCVVGVVPVLDCDPYSGNSTKIAWDPAGRTLYLGTNVTLWLGAGVYNFCSLYLDNGAQIKLDPGAKTSIFVDSPADPNSGAPSDAPANSEQNTACSSAASAKGVAAGSFTMQQGAALNAGSTALNLRINVYGDTAHTPPTNNVTLNNVSTSSFELDAPFSNVTMNPSTNTTFRGAILGYTVSLGNAAGFVYEADSSTLQSGSLQIYYRTFWTQCPALSGSGSPTAGC
jgi:Tfp pilus assembly protein PilX